MIIFVINSELGWTNVESIKKSVVTGRKSVVFLPVLQTFLLSTERFVRCFAKKSVVNRRGEVATEKIKQIKRTWEVSVLSVLESFMVYVVSLLKLIIQR